MRRRSREQVFRTLQEHLPDGQFDAAELLEVIAELPGRDPVRETREHSEPLRPLDLRLLRVDSRPVPYVPQPIEANLFRFAEMGQFAFVNGLF